MAVQLLGDLATVSSVADTELLLIENSGAHKAVTKANLLITHAKLSGAAFTGAISADTNLTLNRAGDFGAYIKLDRNGSQGWLIHGGTGINDDKLGIRGATNVDKLIILQNGNIGIGTTAPEKLLSIKSISNPTLQLWDNRADNDNSVWSAIDFTGSTLSLGANPTCRIQMVRTGPGATGEINFQTRDSGNISQIRMILKDSGNVGIGTTSPSEKLEVSGNILANGIQLSTDKTQTIKSVYLQLTQAQIQNLNTTPIELVAAPGEGKYIQILSGSASLNHNGTTYTGGVTTLRLSISGIIAGTGSGFIDNVTSITSQIVPSFAYNNSFSPLTKNTKVVIQSNFNTVDNGGTIDVYVQYVIIDTN